MTKLSPFRLLLSAGALCLSSSLPSMAGQVSVSFDNVLSGVTDDAGNLVTTATAKVGWFQGEPMAIGSDVAALEAAFVEVGSTSQGSFSEFNTAFNFDDGGSFEGVPYAEFAGQAMYGLIVSAGGTEVGVVRFADSFPAGASAVPPDTSSSAGWNPGTATPIIGGFTGPDIGGGNPSFQMVPANSAPQVLEITQIDKAGPVVTISYQSGGQPIDLFRSPDLDDFSVATKIATDGGDGTVTDPEAPALKAFYVIVPEGQVP